METESIEAEAALCWIKVFGSFEKTSSRERVNSIRKYSANNKSHTILSYLDISIGDSKVRCHWTAQSSISYQATLDISCRENARIKH